MTGMSLLPSPSIQLARSLPVGIDDLKDMSAFDLFQSQLESNSTEAEIDAMKRLAVVAITMGKDDAQATLIPYLTQIGTAQPLPSDELLLILGQELPAVAKFIGPACVVDFLPLLERLAAVEETVVRDQAVVALCELLGQAGTGLDAIPWTALAKRLGSADWFTAKVSACGVVASILQLNNSNSEELLALYKDLCQDETPMVRRAAAKHIGKVLGVAGYEQRDFCTATLPVLCRDEQDSVRLLAIGSLADAGSSFSVHPSWTATNWLPLVKDGSTDMSWRVRNNLAKNFANVANNLGFQNDPDQQTEQSVVMACFVALLMDSEAEVRAASVGHLSKMVSWGGATHFSSHLQSLLPALADDVVMEVRSKCALALMSAAHSGVLDDAVILQSFGPLLESFLQDEFQEVQLQVLTNLDKIAHLLPALSGVVTSLLQMSKASNWRVREAVARLLPHLAQTRGLDFFANVLLEPAWLTLLLDPVATVRNAIVRGMPLLVSATGEEWLTSKLIPEHVQIFNQNSSSYLIRMTIIQGHVEAAVALKDGPLWNELMVLLLRGLNDRVPNVRMVAAQGLAQVMREGDSSVIEAKLRPALEKRLQEDHDEDCRRCISLALEVE
jgi:serine/threonine-protein phosphatase 2A regulatory subunit A